LSEFIRVFLSFDIESEDVKNRLKDAQRQLIQTGADLRLVEVENIHMTIRFLGDITFNMADKVFEEMKKILFVPFKVHIHGLGVFPDLRYPRVVWAGILEGAEQLKSVFGQLEPRLNHLGFAPDPRGFSPHLTIARVCSERNKAQLTEFVVKNAKYDFGIVKGESLRLKRSVLTPNGPIYSSLKEFCSK
jgi:2'-5' RNA ligase